MVPLHGSACELALLIALVAEDLPLRTGSSERLWRKGYSLAGPLWELLSVAGSVQFFQVS